MATEKRPSRLNRVMPATIIAKAPIQLAEQCGFTTTLIAEHIINPRNQELDQLETWTAAALAEATNSTVDYRCC